MKTGIFKAKAISGSEQYGSAGTGTLQVAVSVIVKLDDQNTEETAIYLNLSPKARSRSESDLKLLGWDGMDIMNLHGLGSKEVEVRVWDDSYDGKPQRKIEVMGSSRIIMSNPMSKEEFRARLAAQGATMPVGGSGGGHKDIPF